MQPGFYLRSPLVRSVTRALSAAPVIAVMLAAACGAENGAHAVRIEAVGSPEPPAVGSAQQSHQPEQPRARVTVFIDAGHGGIDPGWGSQNIPGVPPEKDLTLDVAKRTAAYLEEAGYRVVLSRTADVQLNDPKRDLNGDGCIDPIDEIQARIDLANSAGAAALLSIHFNGKPGTQLSGSGTYYNAVREFSDRNKRLAELIQEAQLKALAAFGHQARDWGVVRDDSLETGSRSECATSKYFALIGPALPGRPRPSMMPGVIAEIMFLTYPKEAELAARAEVRDALARAFAEALGQFLSDERRPTPPTPGGRTAAPPERASTPASR